MTNEIFHEKKLYKIEEIENVVIYTWRIERTFEWLGALRCFERTNYPGALSILINCRRESSWSAIMAYFEKQHRELHEISPRRSRAIVRWKWTRKVEFEGHVRRWRTSRMHRRESSRRGINRFLHSVQRRATAAPPVSFNENTSTTQTPLAVIDSITSGNYEG